VLARRGPREGAWPVARQRSGAGGGAVLGTRCREHLPGGICIHRDHRRPNDQARQLESRPPRNQQPRWRGWRARRCAPTAMPPYVRNAVSRLTARTPKATQRQQRGIGHHRIRPVCDKRSRPSRFPGPAACRATHSVARSSSALIVASSSISIESANSATEPIERATTNAIAHQIRFRRATSRTVVRSAESDASSVHVPRDPLNMVQARGDRRRRGSAAGASAGAHDARRSRAPTMDIARWRIRAASRGGEPPRRSVRASPHRTAGARSVRQPAWCRRVVRRRTPGHR